MESNDDGSVQKVKANIKGIFDRRLVASIALCNYYAGIALKDFRVKQDSDTFWTDRTRTAHNTVFSEAIKEPNEIGFFLSHMVEYGVYLELANDRKHEALRPMIEGLRGDFMRDLRRIWE